MARIINASSLSRIRVNRNLNVNEDNVIEISDGDAVLSIRFVYYAEKETEDGNVVRKVNVINL